MRSEGHIHLFSRAEKLVGRLETAEHPAPEPPTYCLCSRRRIKCTQREVVFISGMKVQWRMCVTIAACWWGSRFIVSAAWPVEPVIKSNVWWVPHSSPWLQNQLNGSIYFIYWINSILLCNRAHSELLLGLWNASDIASITGLILLEIPSSDIPAVLVAWPLQF